MKQSLLRNLLLLDAAVLILLGALMVLTPRQVAVAFQFHDLPPGFHYILGLWGCVFATLGMGYALASRDPLRNIAWVQVGIARGGLECVLGLVYVARGVVTWQQAGFGIAVAAFITIAYALLYPRPGRSRG